jgi:GntR family transcriptional regulator
MRGNDDVELPRTEIDRESPVPFHSQLARILRQEITLGRWKPGQRLGSEPDLCVYFDVSRSTVRQALQTLETEGRVSREKGRGTFVADNDSRSWLLQSPQGFFHEEVDRLGHSVTSRILRAEIEPLPTWATVALRAPEGTVGVTLERVRSVDGRVALYVVNHLSTDLAESVLSLGPDESLYARLERDDLRVFGGQRSVEAVRAGKRLAKLLETDESAPISFIESVSWDRDMAPFDCYRAWLRTDRLRIEIAVSSPQAEGDSEATGPRADHVGVPTTLPPGRRPE